MLQIQQIKENKATTIEGLNRKYFKGGEEAVEQILSLDEKRRSTQVELDGIRFQLKEDSKKIGIMRKIGMQSDVEEVMFSVTKGKVREKELEEVLKATESELYEVLVTLPNLPHSSVPAGKTPEENEVVLENGTIPTLPEGSVPHWDLIKKYDIIDFELGNKIAGAGFPVYKGKGARIQRALINYFLDEAIAAGYMEIQPPILINKESGFGTGQLPDKDGQMYHATVDDLFLIPTAEVPITNMYRDVILQESELPIKNAGYTPCFRREAGSWGAHVRGLNRLHQFDKIEIVRIEKPENSYAALEEMSLHVQGLLQKLELPYRVLRLCGGDMSFTSALTYDMETWSAAQGRWLEVSSVSNFETYQANRLKLRMKTEGKSQLLHTLNGSALALPRILATILENNQTPDGIKIPKVLVPYCGFEMIG
jgi:seryl-tRNA synthetase